MMTCNCSYIYSDELLNYHFHADHPFNQKRVLLTTELLMAANQLQMKDIIKPRLASDNELALFHDRRYIEAVKKASYNNSVPKHAFALEYGLGTEDTPIFNNMHESSALIVGATLTAVEQVFEGGQDHVLSLAGGLHHGLKRKASGFCIYNDVAVAIKFIREHYNCRVLYVDTDAHHGDGVQWAFYDDPNVCTFSIHETGRYLFPGTGDASERGIKMGHGYTFNLPLDAFTQDESFLHVYKTAFKEICSFFQPDIIITQNGADAHYYDPLTHLCASMEIYEEIPSLAHKLAHEYCNGKWIALGGGGYDIWRSVPRAWGQIWNVMRDGLPKEGKLPIEWLNKWQPEALKKLPTYWHDLAETIPTIPRKAEINEKNIQMLERTLKYLKQEK